MTFFDIEPLEKLLTWLYPARRLGDAVTPAFEPLRTPRAARGAGPEPGTAPRALDSSNKGGHDSWKTQ